MFHKLFTTFFFIFAEQFRFKTGIPGSALHINIINDTW